MRDKGKGKEEEGLLKYNQKKRSCMAKKIGKLDKQIWNKIYTPNKNKSASSKVNQCQTESLHLLNTQNYTMLKNSVQRKLFFNILT